MSITIEWRGDHLNKRLERPFIEVNQVLGREFQRAISSPVWGWPTSPSPRDIVDTGRLRDSYDPSSINSTTYEHAWPVEYALAVILGAVLTNGASLPARNWVMKVLREFDFARVFARLAR